MDKRKHPEFKAMISTIQYGRGVRKALFILMILSGIGFPAMAELPERARGEQQCLQQLEAAAEKYPSRFVKNVNTGALLLSHLDIIQNVEVDGQAVITLPEDIVSVLHMFQGMVFNTRGTAMKVSWRNADGIHELSHWWGKNSGSFAFLIPNHPQKFSGKVDLIVSGKGTIDLIRLYHSSGISLVFDEEPWGIPVGDEAVQNVKISLDATTRFSIAGISELDRKKYMRVYGLADGPRDFQRAAEYFTSKGWTTSRGAGKKMMDWSEQAEPIPWQMESIRSLYPVPPGEVFCFSAWPESMNPQDPSLPEGTGAPAVEKFDEAAELAAKVISNRGRVLQEFAGPWCEVKNESDISGNWAYFADEQKYDAWKLLADFHNRVADAVKQKNPGWLVGGPSSCMPSVDLNEFRRGEDFLTFMDRTHEHLDYWSLHFYERDNFRLLQPDQHTRTYLFGRLEGILDLFRSKMSLQQDMKPFLITEYGGSRSPATDVGFWKFIRSANALMMRFMQHPDCVEMSVPFVIPIAFWSKQTAQPINDSFQLFVYDENRQMQLTNLHVLLDFWSDFQGHRIVSAADVPGVTVNALQDGNVVYLAVNNLSQKRICANVQGQFGSAQPVKIEQTRLYIENGKIVFRQDLLTDLKKIPLAFDETSIIKIVFDRAPEETGSVDQQVFFADRIMVPTGQESEFIIHCPTERLTDSKIRISLGRNNGFESDLAVSVNGRRPASVSLEQTRKQGMYYGTIEVPVSARALRETNRITVCVPDSGGKITSVVLQNRYRVEK